MPFTLTMPKLSPTMEEGVILKWHKSIDEFVEVGDLLLEVSTDKATVEYNALDSGWLRLIMQTEGKSAKVNEPIALFTEEKNENITPFTLQQDISPQKISSYPNIAPQEEPSSHKNNPPKKAETKSLAPQSSSLCIAKLPTNAENRVLASPLAKKLAQDYGVDLATVTGTGPNGRIVSRDVPSSSLSGHTLKMPQTNQPLPPLGHFEKEEMGVIRKVISERLQKAKSTIPHFYVRQDIDVEPLLTLREQLKNGQHHYTLTDLLTKATSLALFKHSSINSGFDSLDNKLIRFKTIDISIAVSIPDGLITPIIHYANTKSIATISQEIKNLVEKAKQNKLQPHEFQGGSFTLSNLGMFGITDFQAIINPPQGAILAISGIQEVPVVKKDLIVPGKRMSLSLSCDHRVIDGADAAEFLRTLKAIVENPAQLLI